MAKEERGLGQWFTGSSKVLGRTCTRGSLCLVGGNRTEGTGNNQKKLGGLRKEGCASRRRQTRSVHPQAK